MFKKEWVNNLTEKLHIFLQDEDRRMKEEVRAFATVSRKDQKEQKIKISDPSVAVEPALNLNLKLMEEKNSKLFQ